MAKAVEAINLTKRYKDVTALNSMNLTIPEGAVFGVIGPNGAGKSTFMRILCDLVRPTSGTVRVLGVDPKNSDPDAKGLLDAMGLQDIASGAGWAQSTYFGLLGMFRLMGFAISRGKTPTVRASASSSAGTSAR